MIPVDPNFTSLDLPMILSEEIPSPKIIHTIDTKLPYAAYAMEPHFVLKSGIKARRGGRTPGRPARRVLVQPAGRGARAFSVITRTVLQ